MGWSARRDALRAAEGQRGRCVTRTWEAWAWSRPGSSRSGTQASPTHGYRGRAGDGSTAVLWPLVAYSAASSRRWSNSLVRSGSLGVAIGCPGTYSGVTLALNPTGDRNNRDTIKTSGVGESSTLAAYSR